MSMKDIQAELKAPKGQFIMDIAPEELAKHFSYCPETGELARLTRKNSSGSVDAYGYKIIKFKGVQLKSHRICYALHHGVWPAGVIDHIDGDRTNNRIQNIRDVSPGENTRNTCAAGIHKDEKTKGLIAKYRVRGAGTYKNFRRLSDAQEFRSQLDAELGITRRAK
jgi:hypothetical protein